MTEQYAFLSNNGLFTYDYADGDVYTPLDTLDLSTANVDANNVNVKSTISIGNTSPLARFEIYSNRAYGNATLTYYESTAAISGNSDEYPRLEILAYTNNYSNGDLWYEAPEIGFFRAAGTANTPTVLATNNNVGVLYGRSWNPTVNQFVTVSQIDFVQTGNVFSNGNQGDLVFRTSNGSNIYTPAERMRITYNGNVGIGTQNPSGKFQVSGSAGQLFTVTDNLTNGSIFSVNDVSGIPSIDVNADGTVKIVQYGGQVGVGTANLESESRITISKTSETSYSDVMVRDTNGNNVLRLGSWNNGSEVDFFDRATGVNVGYVWGDNGVVGIGSSAAGNVPLVFWTAGNEKARIEANGNFGVGTNTPATRFHVNGTIRYTNRPAAATVTLIGYDVNGDLTNSSSSLRYKHDIQTYDKGLEIVKQLRPVSFKFNGEGRENIGFIAEEVDELGLTEVMLYDEEGKPDGVLYSNMVSLLTKALQEAVLKIETLETRIEALEQSNNSV